MNYPKATIQVYCGGGKDEWVDPQVLISGMEEGSPCVLEGSFEGTPVGVVVGHRMNGNVLRCDVVFTAGKSVPDDAMLFPLLRVLDREETEGGWEIHEAELVAFRLGIAPEPDGDGGDDE